MSHITEPIALIGITGQAGTGKDTVADYLAGTHHFEVDAFAEPLRDMLTALCTGHGIDYALLFERASKEQPLPHIGISPRRLMQTLGTEWGRALDPQLWVKLAAVRLGLHDLPNSSPVHDRIVLSDVRFAEEAAWIRSHGGRIVRVTRAGAASVASHLSETQPIRADVTIANDGTIPELYRSIDRMLYTFAGPVEV